MSNQPSIYDTYVPDCLFPTDNQMEIPTLRLDVQPSCVEIPFLCFGEQKRTKNMGGTEDVCDTLTGKYPKDFVWTGWHPMDMCYCVSILKSDDEFWRDLGEEEPGKSEKEVTDVPDAFKDWVRDNADRIEAAEKRGTQPYFVLDNKEYIDGILKPRDGEYEANNGNSKQEVKKTPQEIAAERHAARTQEDIDRIQSAWNTNRLNHLMDLSERIGSYRDADFRELASLLEMENNSKEFSAFKKDYQTAKNYINTQIGLQTALVREFMEFPANADNMKALAKALGVNQGEYMTFFEANVLRGNPNYAVSEAFRVNCQTCVVAHELRRRGFNIEALANTKGSWLEKLSGKTNGIWIDADGNIPEKIRIGAKFNKKYEKNGVGYGTWEKTVANRKQLINALESSITEDGRYHIDWTWNSQSRRLKGHIITFEKIGDTLRYYDPQNGKVIESFYDYIANIKLSRGIRYLRVDNLRIDTKYAAHVLGKSGSKVLGGEIGKGGIGALNPHRKKEWNAIIKQAKKDSVGYESGIKYNKDLFYTHRFTLSKDDRNCLLAHTYTLEEVEAVKKLPSLIENLKNPRYDALNISRPNIKKR